MAKLFWLQPDNTIVEFPLKGEQSLIGRGSRCAVRIKHPGISSEHAIIRRATGAATVEDMGSTNGTRVNGRRIDHVQTLRHGDQIGVGRERLMYFAELDSAANFLQPESIEPFALPAPGGETVNTGSAQGIATPSLEPLRPAPMQSTPAALPAAGSKLTTRQPVLDASLLAALPKGHALAATEPPPLVEHNPTASRRSAPAAAPVAPAAASTTGAGITTTARQSLLGSVAVLSGPATGKRYPLTQASVTLGKEGKQVVEFVRATPTRWQIRQREGATPAYINGDALDGVRELAAGDVIELTGVRLRFDIMLTRD